jgi:SAM-dependent methyltransferase
LLVFVYLHSDHSLLFGLTITAARNGKMIAAFSIMKVKLLVVTTLDRKDEIPLLYSFHLSFTIDLSVQNGLPKSIFTITCKPIFNLKVKSYWISALVPEPIVRYFIRIFSIDPYARRIDYARRLYPRHKFHVFDGKVLPVENETVDNLLIIAVLHHIPSKGIASYMKQFKRILKPNGTIIVMEPFLCKKKPLCNWFMKWYDNVEYIHNEDEYIARSGPCTTIGK